MSLAQPPDAAATRTPVSVMIFTLNEAVHLPSCLAALAWCDDVIVVDSFSTDTTESIAREAGARIFQHKFTGFGDQRNWALDNCTPAHEWILILDADERVTPALVAEMTTQLLQTPASVGAFRIKRRFHMWGQWLKHSSLYPTWVVRLVHRDRVRYVNRGHAETQIVDGSILEMSNDLIDENLKGIDEWFERQNRYSSKDAEYELQNANKPVAWSALLSNNNLQRRAAVKQIGARLPFRPLAYFLYSYVFRLGFLDGSNGFHFCLMKALYQRMILIKKYDMSKRAP
ncbi:MAG: glycosyltransferase family 2 protein [Pseudomonadota bacterium]